MKNQYILSDQVEIREYGYKSAGYQVLEYAG
jgi:hypothetical protein